MVGGWRGVITRREYILAAQEPPTGAVRTTEPRALAPVAVLPQIQHGLSWTRNNGIAICVAICDNGENPSQNQE